MLGPFFCALMWVLQLGCGQPGGSFPPISPSRRYSLGDAVYCALISTGINQNRGSR